MGLNFTLICVLSCSLTSNEVRKLYWKGGAEANESTDVVFLSRTEALQLNRSSPLWSELCPSAKGAMLLYQTVKPDGESTSRWPHRDICTHKIKSTQVLPTLSTYWSTLAFQISAQHCIFVIICSMYRNNTFKFIKIFRMRKNAAVFAS